MKKKQILKRATVVLLAAAFILFGGLAVYKATPDTAAGETEKEVQECSNRGGDVTTVAEQQKPENGEQTSRKGGSENQNAAQIKAPTVTNSAKPQKTPQSTADKARSSDKPTQPQESVDGKVPESQPTHVHSWYEVYDTSQVPVYGDKCNYCGYGTNAAGGIYAHIDADPFDECGSYSTGAVIRYDTVTERTGYRCPCGATK